MWQEHPVLDVLSQMNQGGQTCFLSSSLCCETEQKDEQEKLYCFHAALILYLLVLVVAIAN